MRGRKPKPAAIRALHDSRKRPHHHEEPTIPGSDDGAASTVSPPHGLIQAELAYWNLFAPLLAGAKILTPADVETLGDYCRACVAIDVRSRRLRTAMSKRVLDQSLVRWLDGSVRGWVEKKTKLASELGLTAISRTRVAWSGHPQVLDKAKKPQSKLAQLQQEQSADLRRPGGDMVN